MRIAIVHHWLVSQGGGERVVETLASMFPEADIFTLVASPKGVPQGLQNRQITQSFLARLPFSTRIYRHLLPLYPMAVEHLDLSSYDMVISSDAGPMKGVIIAPEAIHICYCHSPMRYVWNKYREYRNELSGIAKYAFSLSAHYVRGWDFSAAQRVTHFLANSNNVAARIRQYYSRESTVLYPPVDTSKGFLAESIGDHYLTVGRLVAYKRIDLVIAACNRLGRKLRVIGTGPEERHLRAIAGRTIEFLGPADSTTLWREYAHCRALLFAAEEDFGMVPVEAQSCGRPVIAYGKGGALESIVQGSGSPASGLSTGLFFYNQSAHALSNAIIDFESRERQFHPPAIREWARRFDSTHFVTRFREFLEQVSTAPPHSPQEVVSPLSEWTETEMESSKEARAVMQRHAHV
jgi:glycosyltransferase involved in cell wall biosynthesis